MFTRDTIDGKTAAAWGLANASVPAGELDRAAMELAGRIAGVPRSHLAMHKMVVNQAMLTMGLEQTQMFATVFDGITRHNPEELWQWPASAARTHPCQDKSAPAMPHPITARHGQAPASATSAAQYAAHSHKKNNFYVFTGRHTEASADYPALR